MEMNEYHKAVLISNMIIKTYNDTGILLFSKNEDNTKFLNKLNEDFEWFKCRINHFKDDLGTIFKLLDIIKRIKKIDFNFNNNFYNELIENSVNCLENKILNSTFKTMLDEYDLSIFDFLNFNCFYFKEILIDISEKTDNKELIEWIFCYLNN